MTRRVGFGEALRFTPPLQELWKARGRRCFALGLSRHMKRSHTLCMATSLDELYTMCIFVCMHTKSCASPSSALQDGSTDTRLLRFFLEGKPKRRPWAQFKIPESHFQVLRGMAKRERKTIGQLVIQAVVQKLDREEARLGLRPLKGDRSMIGGQPSPQRSSSNPRPKSVRNSRHPEGVSK